jgi:hypothetical protein
MRGRKCLLLWILLVLMLALSGCGDSSRDYADVSGTLTLPANASGKTYWVAIDNDIDGGNGVLYETTGTCGTGTKQDYSIPDVYKGTYYIHAIVYVVSSSIGPPSDGDYVGIYGGSLSSMPTSANATVPSSGTATFDITLETCSGC